MANVMYSAGIDEIRGKIGGTVYQRSNNVMAARRNTTLPLSFSAQQMRRKIDFHQVCEHWHTLSIAQKTQWNTVSNTYPTVDKFGNHVKRNEYQIYLKVNMPYYLAFGSFIDNGVIYVAPTRYTVATGTINLGNGEFYLQVPNMTAQVRQNVYISHLHSSSVRPNHPHFMYLMTLDYTMAGFKNIFSPMKHLLNGIFYTGYNIVLMFMSVDATTGCSEKFEYSYNLLT
jgi:hypothetical protein